MIDFQWGISCGDGVSNYRRGATPRCSRHSECLPECIGRSHWAVTDEGKPMLDTTGFDHLARDHLEMASLAAMPVAHVAAVKPDHDCTGWLCRVSLRGVGGGRLPDGLAHPPRPVPHRARVLRSAHWQ